MTLEPIAQLMAVCRLSPDQKIPDWALRSKFLSITKTDDELSIVCDNDIVPPGLTAERGWRALTVTGPLDFTLTGVLHSILTPLAEAKISIFAISTYDTDFVLIKNELFDIAIQHLRKSGHEIIDKL